jgi:hypothetical protein
VQAFTGWWLAGFLLAGVASGDGWIGAIGGVVLYLVSVQVWPWAPCKACGGNPRQSRDPGDKKYWRLCSTCGGKGQRLRLLALPRG